MQDKYIGLVKKFYDEKGIEQIAIVEAVHMIYFAEWLEQYAAQHSVHLTGGYGAAKVLCLISCRYLLKSIFLRSPTSR